MPDVCGVDMCRALGEHGALGILPRFQPIDEQAAELREVAAAGGPVAAALGVTGDYRDRFARIIEAGCRIVCLDTANGAHEQQSAHAVRWIREQGTCRLPDRRQRRYPRDIPVARGPGCGRHPRGDRGRVGVRDPHRDRRSTRRHRGQRLRMRAGAPHALIIADGGVRSPADMCKLLALGADCGDGGVRRSPAPMRHPDASSSSMARSTRSCAVRPRSPVQRGIRRRRSRVHRGSRVDRGVQGQGRRCDPALRGRTAQLDVVHGRALPGRISEQRELHPDALAAARAGQNGTGGARRSERNGRREQSLAWRTP